MNSTITLVIAIALYLVTTALLVARLIKGKKETDAGRIGIIGLGLGAVIMHASILYDKTFSPAGMNLGFFNALSLVSWLIALLVLITALRKPVESLGIVFFPLAILNIILENTLQSEHFIQSSGPWQLQAHILISIIAYSLFSIAMLQAILVAIQDHHLRNRHPGGFIRSLPPLQSMESLLFQIIGVGFIMLTIGLLMGSLYLDDMFARHLAHKTVLSIIAWILFAILLWGRLRHGWRGRTAIRWTLGGFIALMLAYFGSKLVLELVIGR